MSCRSVLALLPLLVEGDLPDAETSEAREHLATCPACRAHEAALRESQAWLRGAAASAPPPFDETELAAIRASVLGRIERPARSFRLEWLGVTAALAAALVLAVLPGRLVPAPDAGPITRARLHPAPAPTTPTPPTLVATQAEPPAVTSAPGRVQSLHTVRTASAVRIRREPAVASGLPAGPDLRLELATPNPNVRIIWFVPSTPS